MARFSHPANIGKEYLHQNAYRLYEIISSNKIDQIITIMCGNARCDICLRYDAPTPGAHVIGGKYYQYCSDCLGLYKWAKLMFRHKTVCQRCGHGFLDHNRGIGCYGGKPIGQSKCKCRSWVGPLCEGNQESFDKVGTLLTKVFGGKRN